VTTLDLTILVLAPFVFLLLAYPLLNDRSARQAGADAISDRAPLAQPAAPRRCSTSVAELPTRDVPEALRMAGGSVDIADSLLAQMLAELPAQTETLAATVAAGDWPAACGIVRDIKGGTALCGVPALHAAVCRLQAAVRDENPRAIAPVLAEVDHERRRLPASNQHGPAALPIAGAGAG
jgi:HPt (histidine-containing phosphotransfer) domain-containing protein